MTTYSLTDLLAARQPNIRDYFTPRDEIEVKLIQLGALSEMWVGDDNDALVTRVLIDLWTQMLERTKDAQPVSSATVVIMTEMLKAMEEFISTATNVGAARTMAVGGSDLLTRIQEDRDSRVDAYEQIVRARLREEAELREAPAAG